MSKIPTAMHMSKIPTAMHPTQGITDEPKIEILDKEGNQWRLALYLWDGIDDGPVPDAPDVRLEHICPDTAYKWMVPDLDFGCAKCGPIPDKLMDKFKLLKNNDDDMLELQQKFILTAKEFAKLGNHKPHNGVQGVDEASKSITVDSLEMNFPRKVYPDE